jgi:predicted ATPase
MRHLKSLTIREGANGHKGEFPFNLPVIQSLKEMTFTAPVTFFVGENGSGKSTLLEAIACAADSITVGSENVTTDKGLTAVRKLAKQFRLSWQKRTHRGFFLRAEDFFGYAKKLAEIRADLQAELEAVDAAYKGRSPTAVNLAKLPYNRELAGLKQRYGQGLDTYSHGESFLTLFQARFVPDGLYLLDEPEAPLSPLRQLAFLSALKQMVQQNSQFIIATHSPIIMAFPGAVIWQFDASQLRQVSYEELEHVQLTKAFLNNPEVYLQHL